VGSSLQQWVQPQQQQQGQSPYTKQSAAGPAAAAAGYMTRTCWCGQTTQLRQPQHPCVKWNTTAGAPTATVAAMSVQQRGQEGNDRQQ
jgi:hypothetical protein